MKQAVLQNFRSMDAASFSALMLRHGFSEAACYRLSAGALVQILSTETKTAGAWPAAIDLPDHYTVCEALGDSLAAQGWLRPPSWSIQARLWPKTTVLYLPEQNDAATQIVFAGRLANGKRVRFGALDGVMEATSTRIAGWFREQAQRQAVLEDSVRSHLKSIEVDLRSLIDHELRTPLASVSGYVMLMQEDGGSLDGEHTEHLRIVDQELARAMIAIDKLSQALQTAETDKPDELVQALDAHAALAILGQRLEMQTKAGSLANMASVRVQVRKLSDDDCRIAAAPRLFECALWEVLKNAAAHTRSGQVDVRIYVSDQMLVIDIEDDGPGTSPGTEELIFLRFFQDPGTSHKRRGQRGLGLGLFLARQIVERHLGRLLYMRQRGGSLFRFLWPLLGGDESWPKS